MLIVGDNLIELVQQHEIVNKSENFDVTCISLKLGSETISYVKKPGFDTLVYGEHIPEDIIEKKCITDEGIIIPPHSSVLASSYEYIKMPIGYFGLIQTKGSLARLFVSIQFSDGQVDPGFAGKLTFEIFNGSEFNIKLHKTQKVANLYIFKTSTKNIKSYKGKYNNANGPTIAMPED